MPRETWCRGSLTRSRAALLAALSLSSLGCGRSTRGAVRDDVPAATAGQTGIEEPDAGDFDAGEHRPPIEVDAGSGPGAFPPGATLVATSPDPINSFTVDAENVYFSTEYAAAGGDVMLRTGAIYSCPLSGSDRTTTLARDQDFPTGLSVSGTTLYWINENGASLMHCGVDCKNDATPFYTWTLIGAEGGYAVDGARAYVADVITGVIGTCPTDDCASPTNFATGQATATQLQASGDTLFWLDYGTRVDGPRKLVTYVDGAVMSCPMPDCEGGPRGLATGLSYPAALHVQNGTVYWAQGGSLVRCAATGCEGAPETVFTPPSASVLVDVAIDGDGIYLAFLDGATQWLGRCSLDGCPDGPTVLVSSPYLTGSPTMLIVTDPTRVYYLANARQIVALPK